MAESSTWLDEQKCVLAGGMSVLERATHEVIDNTAKELKRRDEEHRKELKNRDEQHQIVSNRMSEEVVKNKRLLDENSRLKHQLQRVAPNQSTPGTDGSNKIEDTSTSGEGQAIPVEEYRHLMSKYNDLHRLYQESLQKLKYLERKNIAVMQKNREMKESVRAWQQFSERHHNKQQLKSEEKAKLERPHSETRVDDVVGPHIPSSPKSPLVNTTQVSARAGASSPAPISLLSHVEYPPEDELPLSTALATVPTNTDITVGAPANPNQRESSPSSEQGLTHSRQDYLPGIDAFPSMDATSGLPNTSIASHSVGRISSSQTTEDDIATQSRARAVNMSTVPVDDDEPEFVSERSLKRKRGVATNVKVHVDRVTSDGSSNHPHRVKEEQFSSPPSRSIGNHLTRNATLDLDELGPDVISTPRHLRRSHPILVASLQQQCSASVPLIKEELLPNVKPPPLVEGNGRGRLIEEDTKAYSEPRPQTHIKSRVLQPLDPNGRNEQYDEVIPSKRLKRERNRDVGTNRILTEEGDHSFPTNENEVLDNGDATKVRLDRKSHDSGSRVKGAAASRKALTTASRMLPRGYPSTPQPGSRKVAKSASRSEPRMGANPDTRPVWPTPRHGPAAKPPPEPPLRSKPSNELKLSDFKANPAYNQGYSYAFKETVRSREDRACLSGCTRPECCGSAFRTMAEVAPPLSSSQEEALLKDHLGDAYDDARLTQMSTDERHELVLQARTRELSNKHGKHRHAYERQKSPPGFWRIDFPTTQEEMHDREMAAQLERAQVRERRAEAMRRGGKWIFRDE